MISSHLNKKFLNQKFLEIWKMWNFASTKFTYRKQINENKLIILENGSEVKPYQASVNYFQSNCEVLSWSNLISSALKTNQISTLQFEAISHSKNRKFLNFTSIVYEGFWQIDPQFEGISPVEFSELLIYLRWNKIMHILDFLLVFQNSEASLNFVGFFSREMRHFNCLLRVFRNYWYTAKKTHFWKCKICQI